MRVNPVCWFEIYVQDLPRARRFYEGVLGITLERLPGPDFEMWAFPMNPEQPGCGGTILKMDGVPSGGNSTLIYFACDDCAIEEARVTTFGGKVQRAKMSIGEYGFISLAHDPDGNLIGLYSQK